MANVQENGVAADVHASSERATSFFFSRGVGHMNKFDAVLYRWFFKQELPKARVSPVESDAEIARRIVMNLARGDTCLQLGLYVTEEQAEARRKKVMEYRPAA